MALKDFAQGFAKGLKNFIGSEATTLLAATAMYNTDLNSIDEVLKEFSEVGILKSDLFISIYPENSYQSPSLKDTRMLLTGIDVPKDFGIVWNNSEQHFFHRTPTLVGPQAVRLRFILSGSNPAKSKYYKVFYNQFASNGLIKLKRQRYDATIGYYLMSATPCEVRFLTLKDISLGVMNMSEYDPKSSDFAEWSGVVSYDDYEFILK